jgi:hypothetical protein
MLSSQYLLAQYFMLYGFQAENLLTIVLFSKLGDGFFTLLPAVN